MDRHSEFSFSDLKSGLLVAEMMVYFERLLLTQKSLWFTYESQGSCRQWGMLLSVGALFGLRWTHSSFSEGKNAFLDRQAGWT